VVAPSVPGFGFSGPTRDAGWDVPRIARSWAELMRRLRYERYGAQGGDYGSLIYRETGASWGSRPAPSGVPTAVANFQGNHAVRGLAELANTVVRWTEYPVGGHFAALQAPAELVTDIRAFFRSVHR
jgi:pimeloyl-ACP methyl ester carboxylesterase